MVLDGLLRFPRKTQNWLALIHGLELWNCIDCSVLSANSDSGARGLPYSI